MRNPVFPISTLVPFILTISIFTYQMVKEVITNGFSSDSVIIFIALLIFSAITGGLFLAFYTKYKRVKRLVEVCIKPAKGTVIIVDLSSLNTGHSNPTFMDIEFNGNKRSFTNVDSELRFKYKEGDEIDILYNPLNKKEFIFE